ncbi:chitinase, lysozyme [Volvox carteri f. nagariensis]|uniref:Chitinase, lysozyme n=1 Tax=Volvox carteri f. nagariensis TaxID=3068 RepID=D8UFB7_VOLCA|nr:chitinase, lysozyme [Volvox carteri f. nagariensis]EFJ41579.1 chitinase, lysozyme [Volvox carteri f. nagariensis]|eukprot:XP_002957370.1 chitinase, lysozyme [Volvox carteri f. nagariensis]
MPRFSSTLLLLVVAVAASAFIVDTCAADGDSSRRLLASGCTYTIQAGDTFWALAQRRGTTVDVIQSLNPGVDPTRLQVGQFINVPCSGGGYVCTSMYDVGSGCTYTIQPGDTFWAIAQRRGTTVDAIQSLNPGVDPAGLQVGQVINVPCGSNGPAPQGGGSKVLYSGSGSGTYYYDLRTTCPQNPGGFPENNGYPYCASYDPSAPTYKTLAQLGSNNVIAIDRNVLSANRAGLCGKKILVFKDGVPVTAPDGGSFFVWDGCEACVGGGRIDFSLSGLQRAASDACSLGVVPGISWQVVDEVVQQFVPP